MNSLPGQPARARRLFPAWAKSVLALAFVLIALLDGFPARSEIHKRLLQGLRPLLSALGLYQGDWQLFAPDPDQINAWVEARVVRSDGSSWSWTTPDWRHRSPLERFREGRHQKLSDAFRLDSRRALWPYLADYVLRLAPPPPGGVRNLRVELIRYWWDLPEPAQHAAQKARHGRLPPPREQYPNRYLYYSRAVD
jgi:hypothetical protein